MSLPKSQRLEVIAEGLSHLAEHVGTLHSDLHILVECERPRGAALLDVIASEEAAKMVILLDLVRMGWDDQAAVRRQVRRFYDHLARGIYGRLVHGRPASLKEVRDYAHFLRQSHYLDGPNDVDWIFRNQVLADREDSLYVDYIAADGKQFWTTPASRTSHLPIRPSMIIELALALDRVGCTSVRGMEIIAKAWRGVVIEDDTHWTTIESINRHIVAELFANDLTKSNLTENDLRLVYEQWIYPLGHVDLEEVKVAMEALHEEQNRWLANQWGWG